MSPWPAPRGYLATKDPADVVIRCILVECDQGVVLTSVTLAAAPSGTGELALSGLTVAYTTATFTVSGGVAGRVYTLAATATDTSGNTYETLAFQPVDGTLVADPPVVPPSKGFGTPLTWTA